MSEKTSLNQVLHSASVTGTSSAIAVPYDTEFITVSVVGNDGVWVEDANGNKLLAVPAFYSGDSSKKSFVALPIAGMTIKVSLDSGTANVYVTRFFAN
tara:strand:- start:3595 stop:3888 length:294 start_codon:yes stop_codon:yes gene_type:complete